MGNRELVKRSRPPNTKQFITHQHYTSTTTPNKRNKVDQTYVPNFSQKVFRTQPPSTVITNHNHHQRLTKTPSPITANTDQSAELKFLRQQNKELFELSNKLQSTKNTIAERNLHPEIENTTDIQDVLETKTTINSNLFLKSLEPQIKRITKNQVFKKVKFISSKAELTDCQSKNSVGAYFLKCFTKMYPMDTVKNKLTFWVDVQDVVHQSICEKRGAVYNRFKKRWFGKFPILSY